MLKEYKKLEVINISPGFNAIAIYFAINIHQLKRLSLKPFLPKMFRKQIRNFSLPIKI